MGREIAAGSSRRRARTISIKVQRRALTSSQPLPLM